MEFGSLVRILFGYVQFHAVLLATAVFIFVKYSNYEWINTYSKLLRLLSSCSLGIYLIHRIFMEKVSVYFQISVEGVYW